MSQSIKLTLVKSLIMESVKNETYQRGQVQKAADPNGIGTAYHEQAGDEAYHERLLERALQTNLSDLETLLAEYIDSSESTTGDNISSKTDGDHVFITLLVSNRFNKNLTDPLAKLCSKYIEECMLVDWWKPTDEKKSALYQQFADKDLVSIRRCFNKTAPVAPSVPYTSSIILSISAATMDINDVMRVDYILSEGAVDDIEVNVDNPKVASVVRDGNGFTVTGKTPGDVLIFVYSRHNEQVHAECAFRVEQP